VFRTLKSLLLIRTPTASERCSCSWK